MAKVDLFLGILDHPNVHTFFAARTIRRQDQDLARKSRLSYRLCGNDFKMQVTISQIPITINYIFEL